MVCFPGTTSQDLNDWLAAREWICKWLENDFDMKKKIITKQMTQIGALLTLWSKLDR